MPLDAAPLSADAIPSALRRQGGTPRQVLAMTVIGTMLLATFASADLSSWLDRFGDAPLVTPLQRLAADWDGAINRIGLGVPRRQLHSAIRRCLDWEWDWPR